MPNPFYNIEERRIRSLVRIFVHTAIFIGIVGISVILLSPIAFAGYDTPPTSAEIAADDMFLAISGVATLFAITITLLIVGRFIDRRRFSDYGLWMLRGTWWRDFGFGLLLGFVLMAGIFLIEWALGWLTVTGTFVATSGAFASAIVFPIILYICVGFYEEMLSRSYHLLNLAEGLNFPRIGKLNAVVIAWILSSAVFGVLHAANPNASPISTFNITIAGLFLGLGYVLTRSLAIPIGLHISWNFTQGNVFGFPVSGSYAGATFVGIEQGGPELLTGGAFGPEAGVIGLMTILLGMALTVGYLRMVYGTVRLQTELAEYQPRVPQRSPHEESSAIPTTDQSTV